MLSFTWMKILLFALIYSSQIIVWKCKRKTVSVRRLMWLMSFFFDSFSLILSPHFLFFSAHLMLQTETLLIFSSSSLFPPMDFHQVSTCEVNIHCIRRHRRRRGILCASLPTVIFSEFITHETSDC